MEPAAEPLRGLEPVAYKMLSISIEISSRKRNDPALQPLPSVKFPSQLPINLLFGIDTPFHRFSSSHLRLHHSCLSPLQIYSEHLLDAHIKMLICPAT